MSSQIRASKKVLRQSMAQKLASLSHEDISSQSMIVQRALGDLHALQSAVKVGVYMNMDTAELNTIGIIQMLFKMGKRVYLPHCAPLQTTDIKRFDKQTQYLIFYRMDDIQSVLDLRPQGKYQLKEPTSGVDVMDEDEGLDLLLLPAVAYTKDCYRLGHGVGFYDDYIKRHASHFPQRPFLLGTGLGQQLVDRIPLEQHDERLDAVILGDGTIHRQ